MTRMHFQRNILYFEDR